MGYVASRIYAKWANDSYSLCTAQLVRGQKHWYLPPSTDSKKAGRTKCERADRCMGCSRVSGTETEKQGGMHRVEGVTPQLTFTSCLPASSPGLNAQRH